MSVPVLALAATLVAVPQVAVDHDRGQYRVRIEATFELPRSKVFELLTAYDDLERLTKAIRSSRLAGHDADGRAIVDTVTRSCYLLFCKTLEHRQIVTVAPDGSIVATTVAANSDFREGEARWTLEEVDGNTYMTYEMSIRPDFFVPPMIGPVFVRRALEREARALVAGIEAAAR